MSLKVRTAEATLRVSLPHTAEATRLSPADGFPAVLATSRMIELMEAAASRLMQNYLVDGQTSVGIEMNVTHRSTSPIFGVVRAVATYCGSSGRVHRFNINVFDESGLIGSAEHMRAVTVERRLLAITRRRTRRPDVLLMV